MASARTDDDRRLKPHIELVPELTRAEQQREPRRNRRQRRRARRKAGSIPPPSGESGSEEHVEGAAQPASAQTVEELADSFSEKILDDTEPQKSMHGGIEKRANNSTIFSPKQVGLGTSYSEMLADEEESMVQFRCFWEHVWGSKFGSFEDYTFVTPIPYTYGAIPYHASLRSCLQIFSIKVMENEFWRIRWPVEVYGFIAARDTVDHNHNLLFNRTRDDPQILTLQDPFLQLTGPCRPIALIDPVDFEIQLKVKGKTEPDDETFMAQCFEYGHGFGQHDHLACGRWEGNFCTLEITSALLGSTVAANIISADVIEGSWPGDCGGRVVSRTAGIDEDFVLLDSGDGPMHVDPDGHITLQRDIISVRRAGTLKVSVEAYSEAGLCAEDCVEFRPKDSFTSVGTCNLGFCRVMFIVGWSLAAIKSDLKYDGNSCVLTY
uniref:Uncharacterized protein n=1 Tax=Avena sativa TaxID=4498 RepID=A0ACD5ZT07_AVESA